MKLNYDCIRDMLLALEELLTIKDDLCHERVSVDKLFEVLGKYGRKEILYTFRQLTEAGYISAEYLVCCDEFHDGSIYDLTYLGHEFVESVRDNEMWKSVKSILSETQTNFV